MKNRFCRIRHTEVSESVQWKKTVAFKICFQNFKASGSAFGRSVRRSLLYTMTSKFPSFIYLEKKMMSMLDSYDI